ncbi:hypothetical protein [Streptomyces sp. SP17KL33]|uniref:hypothetical protein n=1 Tax=Streptomyces sp. SP17KL33 TaxID=3002534 RepID=UPI002E75E155|nr:hypothetical protein [Streptomyces sp. SP17KL33]MEE1838131.1 hypothetical protein [Streptomyces sp. SP17KL33]
MIRQTPQPGDIGLTSITGAVGRLVQVGQWLLGDGFGAYQHAFIVLPGNRLIEAQPGGAEIASLDAYADRDVLYVSPSGLTPAQRKAICDSALRYVDVPYSFLDYVALAAHRFRVPVPHLRRYIEATGHMICSQLCDRAYLDAGIRLFGDGRWSGVVTPMDLYNQLSSPFRFLAAGAGHVQARLATLGERPNPPAGRKS